MTEKLIFHLDMDQFFAAVELLHQPHLRGQPVIVGGNPYGRGIVTTASYEARRFGVRSGMASSEAFRLCPQAVFVRPDHSKYCEISRQIFQLLREFTDRVEPVSVDEAYLDVSDSVWREPSVEALAMKIKQRIRDQEGLTATIGAGPNRQVAKVASGMNKPDGFTYIPASRVAEVYRDMAVGDLCGVGPSTEKILETLGVRTIGQLAAFPADILRRRLGKWGDELVRMAQGQGREEVQTLDERPQEKSMGHESTFSEDISDPLLLLGRLHLLSERVSRRLRTAGLAGYVVAVKIRYKGFETVLHGRKLQSCIQHETDLYPVAERLFHESYREGRPVRLVGVHVSALIPTSHLIQQELFVIERDATDLSTACDGIKDRFGESAIGFASGVFFSASRHRPNSRRTVFYNPFRFNPLKPL
jgi:DNA polymerase-4